MQLLIKNFFGKITNKFKATVKNEGNNNLNIVNSPGVTLINSNIYDEIQRLVSEGQFDEATSLISRIMNGASAQHPAYPYWRYGIEVKDGQVIFSHIPNSPDALKSHPLKGSFKLKFPQEVTSKFQNLDELVRFSYEKQVPIKLDLISFKTWVGDKIIDSFDENEWDEMTMQIYPTKFPPPTPMKLYLVDGSESYDYLEIGLKEIDGNWFLMNNNEQEHCSIQIQIKFNPTSKEAFLSISLKEEYNSNVRAQLDFIKFIYGATKKTLAIKILKYNMDLLELKKWNIKISEKEVRNRILFLTLLVDLEKYYGVQFKFPDDVTEQDKEAIYILKNTMNKAPIDGTFSHLSFEVNKIEEVKNIIEIAEKHPDGKEIMFCHKDACINLYGQRIEFAESRITYSYLQVKNLELLKKKLEFMEDGDTIKIEFIPASPTKNKITMLFIQEKT